MTWRRIGALGGLALVFALAMALTLVAGRCGYMPLDQSVVFDGAWRVLCGQVPYRDFTTPAGLTPIYLQAGFFELLGTTWFAYVLHAAIANGLFAWVVYALLRVFAAPRAAALVYAAASSAMFYPPIGVPYLEQHAFLFSLCGLTLALWAWRGAPRWERAAWFALPWCFALAWFAKQIPTAFIAPFALAVVIAVPRERRRSAISWCAAGAASVVVALALAGWLGGVDPTIFWDYHVRLPSAQGGARRKFTDDLGKLGWRTWHTLVDARMVAAWIVAASGVAATVALVVVRALRGRGAPADGATRALDAAIVGFLLVFVCILFVAHTSNQPLNGFPYLFASLGLVHAGARELAQGAPRLARRMSWIGAVLVACALVDAARFNVRVNATRRVNDLFFEPAVADAATRNLPRELAFLRWSLPGHYATSAAEFSRVVRFLGRQRRDFLLIGDMSILYALTGKPSTTPMLWWHPGLTMPQPDDPAWDEFERRLVQPILDGRVQYVVLEGAHTWTHRELALYPRLRVEVEQRLRGQYPFGFFTILDFSPETTDFTGDPQ